MKLKIKKHNYGKFLVLLWSNILEVQVSPSCNQMLKAVISWQKAFYSLFRRHIKIAADNDIQVIGRTEHRKGLKETNTEEKIEKGDWNTAR